MEWSISCSSSLFSNSRFHPRFCFEIGLDFAVVDDLTFVGLTFVHLTFAGLAFVHLVIAGLTFAGLTFVGLAFALDPLDTRRADLTFAND